MELLDMEVRYLNCLLRDNIHVLCGEMEWTSNAEDIIVYARELVLIGQILQKFKVALEPEPVPEFLAEGPNKVGLTYTTNKKKVRK